MEAALCPQQWGVKEIIRKCRQQLRKNPCAWGQLKSGRTIQRDEHPVGQAFQASEKHPVGWEGMEGKRLPLAVGWKLQDLLHGATMSGWQWMGAMVGQRQPGQGSWQRPIRLSASQDKKLVPLLRQVEGIQPKYLTLVVAKRRKHLHGTSSRRIKKVIISFFFLKFIFSMHSSARKYAYGSLGLDCFLFPFLHGRAYLRMNSPCGTWSGWVEIGTVLVWAATHTVVSFFKYGFLVLENNQCCSPACAVVDCWRSDSFAEVHTGCCELRGFYDFGVLTSTGQVLGYSLPAELRLCTFWDMPASPVSPSPWEQAPARLAAVGGRSWNFLIENSSEFNHQPSPLPSASAAMFPSSGVWVRDGYGTGSWCGDLWCLSSAWAALPQSQLRHVA